jgi:hypothetical protein
MQLAHVTVAAKFKVFWDVPTFQTCVLPPASGRFLPTEPEILFLIMFGFDFSPQLQTLLPTLS